MVRSRILAAIASPRCHFAFKVPITFISISQTGRQSSCKHICRWRAHNRNVWRSLKNVLCGSISSSLVACCGVFLLPRGNTDYGNRQKLFPSLNISHAIYHSYTCITIERNRRKELETSHPWGLVGVTPLVSLHARVCLESLRRIIFWGWNR